MGLSDRKTALSHQTVIYRRRENSSSRGEKVIIYAIGKLGGPKIGLRIVTQFLSREIKSVEHEISVTRCKGSFDDECTKTDVNVTAYDRLTEI